MAAQIQSFFTLVEDGGRKATLSPLVYARGRPPVSICRRLDKFHGELARFGEVIQFFPCPKSNKHFSDFKAIA